MKAARLFGSRRLEVREVEPPVPGPTQVLIRIHGCGVCGSDLAAFGGGLEQPLPWGAPGHEAWGQVVATGEQVEGPPAPGDLVAGLTYRSYASFDVAEARNVVPLPAELAGVPFPAEPFGCAWNVFTRSGMRPGQVVAVVGIGAIGALVVQLAASAGLEVIAVSRRPYSLEMARLSGAKHVLALDDDAAARVADITGGHMCDVVVEAAGKQAALDVAGGLVGRRRKLVIAGFHQDGLRTVDMRSWNWNGIDVVNAHERDDERYVEGMRQAIQATLQGRIDPRLVITHTFALEDIGSALELALERPPGFLKAVVRPC